MTETSTPVPPEKLSTPGAAVPLGKTASRGMLWLVGNTLSAKVVGMASQIILARLLLPDIWGKVGLAQTVTVVASVVLNPGVDDVLVQRQRHFNRYANAAFWMILACGIGGMLVMLAAAPIGVVVYGRWDLLGLMITGAVGAPLGTLAVLPQTKLRIDLRFGILAWTGVVATIVGAALSVLLAWLGFGAYSFVLPGLVTSVGRAIWLWSVAPTPVKMKLQLKRWKLLMKDSVQVFVSRAIYTLIGYGDYMTLGAMRYSENDVGQYFFAFNQSVQVISLLSGNVSSVLMPTLVRLADDPPRQYRAALASSRLLAFVALPLGLFQAAMAGPIIDFLFTAQWEPARVLLTLLSVGMGINSAGWPMASLSQAQGRFRLFLQVGIMNLGVFILAVVPMTYFWGNLGTAIGVMAFTVVGTFAGTSIIMVACGGRLADLLDMYVRPTLVGAVGVGLGYLASQQVHLPWLRMQGLTQLAVGFAVSASIYLTLMYVVARGMMTEALSRLVDMMPARWRPGLMRIVPARRS